MKISLVILSGSTVCVIFRSLFIFGFILLPDTFFCYTYVFPSMCCSIVGRTVSLQFHFLVVRFLFSFSLKKGKQGKKKEGREKGRNKERQTGRKKERGRADEEASSAYGEDRKRERYRGRQGIVPGLACRLHVNSFLLHVLHVHLPTHSRYL